MSNRETLTLTRGKFRATVTSPQRLAEVRALLDLPTHKLVRKVRVVKSQDETQYTGPHKIVTVAQATRNGIRAARLRTLANPPNFCAAPIEYDIAHQLSRAELVDRLRSCAANHAPFWAYWLAWRTARDGMIPAVPAPDVIDESDLTEEGVA